MVAENRWKTVTAAAATTRIRQTVTIPIVLAWTGASRLKLDGGFLSVTRHFPRSFAID